MQLIRHTVENNMAKMKIICGYTYPQHALQMFCAWEIRATDDQYTIHVNFSDVNLGVNGRNELSVVDGGGVFGGDLKRRMTGVDVNPVDDTLTVLDEGALLKAQALF